MGSLAKHGRLELTAHMIADGNIPPKVSFNFGYDERDYSLSELILNDQSCGGTYAMRLFRKAGKKITDVDYLTTRLAWDTPLYLQAEWWEDGRFTITVNGIESKNLMLIEPVKDFMLEVTSGTVRVENLIYTNLNNRQ